MINAFCENRGWLFEDLKRLMAQYGAVASDRPLPQASAWICLRRRELERVPHLERTVLQVHDVTPPPAPELANRIGAVSFVHDWPARAWAAAGFTGRSVVAPIGARKDVHPSALPHRPTLGYFCREVGNNTKRSPLFAEAVALARERVVVDVLMIGERLEHIRRIGTYQRRAATPRDYEKIDALVATSASPMVPLSLYEACAAGKTVITTTREMPAGDWPMVHMGDTAEALADHIVNLVQSRRCWPPVRPYMREQWARQQVLLAQSLVPQAVAA